MNGGNVFNFSHRFSHAAIAYEQCDRKYKAVFAEPKGSNKPNKGDFNDTKSASSGIDTRFGSLPLPDVQNADGYTALSVIAHPNLNQDMLWKLFDIVPSKIIKYVAK